LTRRSSGWHTGIVLLALVASMAFGVHWVSWPASSRAALLGHPWQIDLRTASEVEMRLLPGIGVRRSCAIMELRSTARPDLVPEDLTLPARLVASGLLLKRYERPER
jgi:hypothetical protein